VKTPMTPGSRRHVRDVDVEDLGVRHGRADECRVDAVGGRHVVDMCPADGEQIGVFHPDDTWSEEVHLGHLSAGKPAADEALGMTEVDKSYPSAPTAAGHVSACADRDHNV